MMQVKNTYFKFQYGEDCRHMLSGRPLPDPAAGPYHFINCDIHPRLWSVMRTFYKTSTFTNTYRGPDENNEV